MFNKYDFKYNINDIIKTNIGEITIVNKFYNNKHIKSYQYKCSKCSNIDKILESDLIQGKGCNVCCPTPRKVLIGYNDINTTAPWMIDYMVDKNNAYKYTYGSGNRILFQCLDCGEQKLMKICDMYARGIHCSKCGDGISYPNKIMYNILSQLNLIFEIEKLFDWCIFKKYNNQNKLHKGRYDFYFKLNNKEYIVEMDGSLHFKKGYSNDLLEVKYIDEMKNILAQEHNIEIIRINCEYSDINYIKNNILKSKLNCLFDLTTIDWLKCDKFATSSRVKEICDLWNNGLNNVTKISNLTKLSKVTVATYLNKGTKIGWCDYNGKNELTKRTISNNKKNLSKPVLCIETGKIYNSASECDRCSEDDFGMKLFQTNISLSCRNNKPYKGFHFKYNTIKGIK